MICPVLIVGRPDEVGTHFVKVGDGPEIALPFKLSTGATRVDRFELDIPAGTTTISVRRDAVIDGVSVTGARTFDVFDLSVFTKGLWNEDKSFCRRVLDLNYQVGRAVHGREADEYGYRPKPRGLFSPRRLRRDDRWIKPMYDTAHAQGVQVPAALEAFAKLNIEPDMGGGEWCGPARVLTDPSETIMINVAMGREKGPEWSQTSQAAFDILIALYERSVTVMGDANHFSGVIWDPVGLSEPEAAALGFEGAHRADGGVFWRVHDDGWQKPVLIRDEAGAPASADHVLRLSFMEYFLRDLGQGLIDEEKLAEDTVFIDSVAPAPRIVLGAPHDWQPVEIELYER